jgi:hypothetical protein
MKMKRKRRMKTIGRNTVAEGAGPAYLQCSHFSYIRRTRNEPW